MSARQMPAALAADAMELVVLNEERLMCAQTATTLDRLKAGVREAKGLLHQARSKVEKLAECLDQMKKPEKNEGAKFK